MVQTTKVSKKKESYDLALIKNLKIGELIAINGYNSLYPAIFIGIGRANNIQYISIKYGEMDRLYKMYLNTNSAIDNRACRFNIKDLSRDKRIDYYRSVARLKDEGIITDDSFVEYIND